MPEINETEEIPEGNFPINLKLIQRHQWVEPILMDKYKDGTYHKFFCGGSNDNITLITCKYTIVIPLKLQSYVLHWYHTYLLHTGMDRTKAMICQHF